MDPHRKRSFRLPFANIISLVAFIIGTLIIYRSGFDVLWKLDIGISAGILIFILTNFEKIKNKFKETVMSGLWFIFYAIAILFVSFFGSKSFGGNNTVRFPYDLLIAINTPIKKEEMKMIPEKEFIGEEFEI